MKYLFIAPIRTNPTKYYEFPLGLSYVSAALRAARGHHEITCINPNHFPDVPLADLTSKWVQSTGADVIATGGLYVHHAKVKTILTSAKRVHPGIKSIVGGGLLSADPELTMGAMPVDFGVIGEGEETIVELADALERGADVAAIAGIVYRGLDGKLVKTAEREQLKQLDDVAWPDYDQWNVKACLDMQLLNDYYWMYPYNQPRMLPMIASRSCPYRCTFCFHPLGRGYRQRSIDNFFKELDHVLARYDANIIAVWDELFTVNRDRIIEFCARMKPYKLKWLTQVRVDSVDEKVLNMLADAGCYYLSYGLESVSDDVLKSMKKKLPVSQVKLILEASLKAQVGIQGNFIFGDPAETVKSYKETLDWWKDHKEYQINLCPIQAYPGTAIYRQAIAKGLITDTVAFVEKGCPPINLTRMTDDQFKTMLIELDEHTQDSCIFADLRKSEFVCRDSYGRELYNLTVKCPHCSDEHFYERVCDNGFQLFKMGCRTCNMRFDLYPLEHHYDRLREIVNDVVARPSSGRIALWGGGVHTRLLMGVTDLSPAKVECIFDNNPLKLGLVVEGVPVRMAPKSVDEAALIADTIIISSKYGEDAIYRQIGDWSARGVKVVRLYGNPQDGTRPGAEAETDAERLQRV